MSSDTSCTSGSGTIASSSRAAHSYRLVGVGALHGQVVGAVAHVAADLNRRRQADECPEPREPQELRTQLLRDLRGGDRAASRRGISWTLKRAVFIDPKPPPVLAKNVSTYGFAIDDLRRPASRSRPCRSTTCPAPRCTLMFSESLSWSGMNPFGTMLNISIVAGEHGANTTSITGAVAQHDAEAPFVAAEQPAELPLHRTARTPFAVQRRDVAGSGCRASA